MARELVISFLYGEFNAALVDGASVIERWSPTASDRAHGFHEAAFRFYLEAVVDHFDYAGQEAVLVVADVEMEHHQVALPPVKGKQRQQLLDVESKKLAEGRPLAFSYMRIGSVAARRSGSAANSGPAKGVDQFLLHCWPQAKLTGYLADFAHVGVVPRLIIPDVALFHAWAADAGLDANSYSLVNSGANGTTVMLADRTAMRVFVRRLSPAIGHSPERLPGEIRRSLQYASQDIGLRPELLVTNDQQLAIDLQAQLDRNITIEIETSWAEQPVLAPYCSGFSRRDTQSYVPDAIRYAKYNRIINRVVKAGIVVIALASGITAGVVEWQRGDQHATLEELEARHQLREQELQLLQREIDGIRGEQAFAVGAGADKQKLSYWIVRDLGAELPSTIRLTHLQLNYGDGPTVELSLKATLIAGNVQRLDNDMRVFGEKLAAEPWLVKWPDDWARLWRNQYINGRRGQQLNIELNGELPR